MRHGILAALLGLLLAPVARAESPEASSQLRDGAGLHGAELAFDGLMSTGWAEGEDGSGKGSWIELRMDRAEDIVSVSVWPGNLEDGLKSVRAYARPKTVTITLSGGGGPDETRTVGIDDPALTGPRRIDVPIRGRARVIRVSVDEAFDGHVHPDDMFIAEVALNFAEGEPHPWVGKVYSWMEGDEGKRPREENLAEVARLKEAAKTDDSAGRAALADLMDQAGDGAPYVRRWVGRYVPLGFRVHAIPPNMAAIEAILDLKNPRAIPALERASVRVKGHDEKRLTAQVEMFYAWQELQGGANPNVPGWGQTGWAQGEIRGFGEPLPIVIDAQGRVWLCDVGNSRVQRFTATGGVDLVLGAGEPDTTDAWIGEPHRWYVSGSRPSDQPGQFQVPIDITLIPGKVEDQVAVLDLTGRVQIFGPEGDLRSTVQAPIVNQPLIAGVGGQAYVLFSADRTIVVWKDSVWVYDAEGNELNRWDITDGVPSAAATLSNGKLVFAFGQQLIMYSSDGYRHGGILGSTLPSGFEAWDVAIDEDGKLWVVTDTGWAIKYKKPGKVDYQVRLSDDGFITPRIAISDDTVYVTHGDKIHVFDALELKKKAELAGD